MASMGYVCLWIAEMWMWIAKVWSMIGHPKFHWMAIRRMDGY